MQTLFLKRCQKTNVESLTCSFFIGLHGPSDIKHKVVIKELGKKKIIYGGLLIWQLRHIDFISQTVNQGELNLN